MTKRTISMVLALAAAAGAQQWLRDRGPGDLLPPQLGGDAGQMADLTDWQFLWPFVRDDLAAAVAPAPLAAADRDAVLAALAAATRDADEETAVLAVHGLGRIAAGEPAAAAPLLAESTALLRRAGPVAEVAAFELGFAARHDRDALQRVSDLANDTAAGRALVGAAAVDPRVRSFALYGLGMCADGRADAQVQFRVLAAVERLLLPTTGAPPEVRIAALHALALVRLEAAPGLAEPALRLLAAQWDLAEPVSPLMVTPHVPAAAAALLRPGDDAAAEWRARLGAALDAPHVAIALRRSCALELGRLCRPHVGNGSPEQRDSERLRAAATVSRDQQVRCFALFSLGRIGGAANERWLRSQPAGLVKPWIVLGLAAGAADHGLEAESRSMIAEAAKTPNPMWAAAAITAAGPARAHGVVPDLLERVRARKGQDFVGAAAARALAELGAKDALDAIVALARDANGGTAGGDAMAAWCRLDDAAAQQQLDAWILDPDVPAERRIAAADARRGRVDPVATRALVATLGDGKARAAERRFAALALGCLCDRSDRHWSARLATAINYRCATPALLGPRYGVLRLP